MKRNITLLFLYGFLIKRFAFPILTIYYLTHHLSFTQIGLLTSVAFLTSILMEIPGGVFADRHGKKTSLMIGAFMALIYSLLLILGNSFLPYLVASLFYGVSYSFISGTREAILYDSLKEENRENEFRKYTGKIRLYVQSLNALIIIAVPFFYELDEKLPFQITAGFYLLAIITAMLMKEPAKTKHDQDIAELHTYQMHFKKGLQELKMNPYVFASIILSVVLIGFFHILADYLQPLLQIAEIEIIYFGLFYTVLRLVQGISALLVHKIDKLIKLKSYLALCILLMIAGFLMMALASLHWILLGVIIMNIGYWMINVLIKDEVNQNINSEHRTTILSMKSFAGSFFSAFVVLSFSTYADFAGIQNTLLYATIILGILGALAFTNLNLWSKS